MALFKVLLRCRDLEEVVLGGRTRTGLQQQPLQVFVDKVLTEDERAQKRAMLPTARRLRAEGKSVRWQGAVLQVRVQSGQGRASWEVVRHQQQPPSPSRRAGGTSGAADGAGAAAAAARDAF